MKYALISDIHGNLPALEAVLADIASRPDIGATYHLGDLVGYGPWPNEVVDLIRASAITGVAGNYDSTVAARYKNCGCRYENLQQEELAHRSYEWTCRNVTSATTTFLSALPFRIDIKPLGGHTGGPRLVLVHAHTTSNLIYVEEDRSASFLSKMARAAGLSSGDAIAFGHTHKPWQRQVEGVYFGNAGSVGRPKDGDSRAGYVTMDMRDGSVTIDVVRVPYDAESVAAAISRSGLPHELASFIRTGGNVVAQHD